MPPFGWRSWSSRSATGKPRSPALNRKHAAAALRPVDLSINGKREFDSAASLVTGSWYPDTQTWELTGVVALRAGKNVLRFESKQPFPHIDKFALIPLPSSFKTPEQLAG